MHRGPTNENKQGLASNAQISRFTHRQRRLLLLLYFLHLGRRRFKLLLQAQKHRGLIVDLLHGQSRILLGYS